MGAWASRKAFQVVEALEKVVAIEMLCAAQAFEFQKGAKPGRGVAAALQAIRNRIKPLNEDRFLGPDIDAMCELMQARGILESVTKASGAIF